MINHTILYTEGTYDTDYQYPGYLYSVFPGGGSGHFISGTEGGSPSAICHQRLQSPTR